MVMPGWYDIKGVKIEDKQDVQGMRESQAQVEALVQQQVAGGIPSENIIIAGFSQGGAVAYHTVLRSQHRFAGLLTLSTYLPFAEQVNVEQTKQNLHTPIFASHGSFDPVVPAKLGEVSVETLRKLGYSIDWKTYPMEHQVIMPQIKDIGSWINKIYAEE
jgi:phospholipase/carboxylesterase